MFERETNREKNLEKAIKEARIKARKEASKADAVKDPITEVRGPQLPVMVSQPSISQAHGFLFEHATSFDHSHCFHAPAATSFTGFPSDLQDDLARIESEFMEATKPEPGEDDGQGDLEDTRPAEGGGSGATQEEGGEAAE